MEEGRIQEEYTYIIKLINTTRTRREHIDLYQVIRESETTSQHM